MIDFKSELETFMPVENIGENENIDDNEDVLDILREFSKQIRVLDKEQ
jgi:hypothetical protein